MTSRLLMKNEKLKCGNSFSERQRFAIPPSIMLLSFKRLEKPQEKLLLIFIQFLLVSMLISFFLLIIFRGIPFSFCWERIHWKVDGCSLCLRKISLIVVWSVRNGWIEIFRLFRDFLGFSWFFGIFLMIFESFRDFSDKAEKKSSEVPKFPRFSQNSMSIHFTMKSTIKLSYFCHNQREEKLVWKIENTEK